MAPNFMVTTPSFRLMNSSATSSIKTSLTLANVSDCTLASKSLGSRVMNREKTRQSESARSERYMDNSTQNKIRKTVPNDSIRILRDHHFLHTRDGAPPFHSEK